MSIVKNMQWFPALLIVLTGLCMSLSCSPPQKLDSITFANLPLESSALVYIAQNKGFYTENGLSVTVKDYPTGIGSMSAILDGTADIGYMTEYPAVGNILQGKDVKLLATTTKVYAISLIGLKSRGITDVSDLRGKRVGLTRNTVAEFFLSRFLDLQGIQTGEITMVDLPSSAWQDALALGSVDAVIGWTPFMAPIQARFGADASSWPAQSYQPTFGILVCSPDLTANNPTVIVRFLKAMDEASNFLASHYDEAIAITSTTLKEDPTAVRAALEGDSFGLSLDQALIIAMEDEARWMITNKLTSQTDVPDFAGYAYLPGMMAVKPAAVNIIK